MPVDEVVKAVGVPECNSLGTTIDLHQLEVTINYPKNKFWMTVGIETREDKLRDLFLGLANYLNLKYRNVHKSTYTFEHEMSINLHLHGIIQIRSDEKCNAFGLIEEASRHLLRDIPPCRGSVNIYENGRTYVSIPRFECPAVCVSYETTSERLDYWHQYIAKEENMKNIFSEV